MSNVTATQLTAILMQKPDRVTRDVLGQINAFECFENKYMTEVCHVDPRSRNANGSMRFRDLSDFFNHMAHHGMDEPFSLSRKMKLHFFHHAGDGHFGYESDIEQDDPRSLKQAMLELKAIGYSHQQIDVLASIVRYTSQIALYDYRTEGGLWEEIEPYFGLKTDFVTLSKSDACDQGFLGGVIYSCPQVTHDAPEIMAMFKKGVAIPYHSVITNPFPDHFEEVMEGRLQQGIANILERTPDLMHPQNNRKAKRIAGLSY